MTYDDEVEAEEGQDDMDQTQNVSRSQLRVGRPNNNYSSTFHLDDEKTMN